MSSEIYKEIILEHAKTPKNKGKVPRANAWDLGANMICGDKVEVTARVSNGKVEEVKFEGGGCAICMACADISCELAKGKKVEDAAGIKPEHLFKKIGVTPSPARMKCALLGLETMKGAITAKGETMKGAVTAKGK